MKNTTAKRAFVTAASLMLICIVMLIGTTFAWFTDTVTVNGNKIKSGNLDIELYKATTPVDANAEALSWTNISDGNTKIFDYAKWEPGYTQFVVLKVKNAGSLALKYNMYLDFNGNLKQNANGHTLADAIDVYAALPADEATLLTAAKAATSFSAAKGINGVSNCGTLAAMLADTDGAAYGTLESGKEAYVVLLLHMQEEAGNEYQGMSLGDGFTVRLEATQLTSESDSFDNQYDANAVAAAGYKAPTFQIAKVEKEAPVTINDEKKTTNETTISDDSDDVKLTIPVGTVLPADTAKVELVVEPKNTAGDAGFTVAPTAGADEKIVYYDIDLKAKKADGTDAGAITAAASGKEYTVELYVGENLSGVKVYHNSNTPIPGAQYNPTTGYVTFKTGSFSPYAVLFTIPNFSIEHADGSIGCYETLEAAIADYNAGEEIAMMKDVAITAFVSVTKDIVINGNGHTLDRSAVEAGRGAFDFWAGNNGIIHSLTVNNMTIKNASGQQGYATVVGMGGENVVFNGCTFENLYCGVIANGCNGNGTAPNITIANCTFKNTQWAISSYTDTFTNEIVLNNNTGLAAGHDSEFHVAKIGNKYYTSLSNAIAAVNNNETITLIKNVDNAQGISVNTGKTFTVDFGGHTYTVNKPGAGSTGTQTNAFQLLKGQTITFKNGTIKADAANLTEATAPAKNIKRFIQNYANLTLDNMTIDGTNVYGSAAVIEFACGTVNITGNTSIKAQSGAKAINVDTWRDAYPAGTAVTINTTGNIGDIHLYAEGTANTFTKSSLTITGGTFSGITADASNDYTVTISGGTFSIQPDAKYINTGYACIKSGEKYIVGQVKKDIGTAEELRFFAAAVNNGSNFKGQTITLTADIDLNNAEWTPIGTKDNTFQGTFDGKNHTISNLKVTMSDKAFAGLFGKTENAAIKDLTINNANVVGKSQVGAVIGSAYTGSLTNCNVTGNITITGNYQTGGITGYGYSTITNCDVTATAGSTITANYLQADFEGDAIGGVIGYLAEGKKTIKDCEVSGVTISGTRKVGGICGQIGDNVTVDKCDFNGAVVCNADSSYATANAGKLLVGGIVGEATGLPVTISNCKVAGTVTGKEAAKTGAIIGGTRATINETNKITETNNTSTATVSPKAN